MVDRERSGGGARALRVFAQRGLLRDKGKA